MYFVKIIFFNIILFGRPRADMHRHHFCRVVFRRRFLEKRFVVAGLLDFHGPPCVREIVKCLHPQRFGDALARISCEQAGDHVRVVPLVFGQLSQCDVTQ